MQGIQQFEKYKVLHAEAKARGDEARVKELEGLLQSIDIKTISTDSESFVNGFRSALNKMK